MCNASDPFYKRFHPINRSRYKRTREFLVYYTIICTFFCCINRMPLETNDYFMRYVFAFDHIQLFYLYIGLMMRFDSKHVLTPLFYRRSPPKPILTIIAIVDSFLDFLEKSVYKTWVYLCKNGPTHLLEWVRP